MNIAEPWSPHLYNEKFELDIPTQLSLPKSFPSVSLSLCSSLSSILKGHHRTQKVLLSMTSEWHPRHLMIQLKLVQWIVDWVYI